MLYTLLIPVEVLLNGSVVLLVIKNKTLHNRGMYLSLQLAAINLIWGTLNYGIIWISNLIGDWAFGEFSCQSSGLILFGFASARWTIILVLTIDRWLTVWIPFRYPKCAGKIATTMSIIGWSIAIAKAILPLQGILGCYAYSPTTGRCDIYCTPQLQCVPLIQASTGFDFGTAIISMLLYVTLFIKARKLNSNQIVPESQASTRAIRWTQSDKRMAKTFLILSLTLIVSTLPIFIIDFTFANVSQEFKLASLDYTKYLHGVARIMVHGVVITDPIVILRNQDVRQAFKAEWNKLKHKIQVRMLRSKQAPPKKNDVLALIRSITPSENT